MHPWIGRFILFLAASMALSGCLSARSYIDASLPPADKQSMAAVRNPQPVQLLYEFRTRGQANARATEETGKRVRATAELSGMFSEVSSSPVANGRRLTI